NHSERDFSAHEHFAHTHTRRGGGGSPRRLLQRGDQVLGAACQHWDESREQSANQHEAHDGCYHHAINADRLHAHYVASCHDEPSESRVGECETCCSSDGEKYERLDEMLTN